MPAGYPAWGREEEGAGGVARGEESPLLLMLSSRPRCELWLLIRGVVEERSPDRTPSYPLGLHPVAGGKGRGGRARTPSVFLLVRDLVATIAAVMRVVWSWILLSTA